VRQRQDPHLKGIVDLEGTLHLVPPQDVAVEGAELHLDGVRAVEKDTDTECRARFVNR
jgi:hypothetical protein